MIFKKSLILFFLIFLPLQLSAFSFFADYKAQKAYQEKDYKKAKTILENEQVDNPDNPVLSYNIGTVNYKLSDYKQAQLNFEHAVKNSKENKFKEISYFNWANSFYKNCLKVLGPDWEKQQIDEKKLDFAINEVQQAVEKYKNSLVLNPENEMAKFNKKKAEELLEKLQEKKQQQEQQKQNQKEDKDKQEQKDQEKQKQQEQQKQEQEKSPQNTDKNKQNKQEQQKREDHSEQSEKEKEDRQNDQLKEEQKKQEQQKEDKHDKSSSDDKTKEQEQQSQQNLEQEEIQNQESEQIVQEQMAQGIKQEEEMPVDIKEKGMMVILNKLQNEESNLQKKLIMQKSKGEIKQLDKNQKPW